MTYAHTDKINAIIFVDEEKGLLASGGGDTMIRIWDIHQKKMIKAFTNNKKTVWKMIQIDKSKIAVTANDNQLK